MKVIFPKCLSVRCLTFFVFQFRIFFGLKVSPSAPQVIEISRFREKNTSLNTAGIKKNNFILSSSSNSPPSLFPSWTTRSYTSYYHVTSLLLLHYTLLPSSTHSVIFYPLLFPYFPLLQFKLLVPFNFTFLPLPFPFATPTAPPFPSAP